MAFISKEFPLSGIELCNGANRKKERERERERESSHFGSRPTLPRPFALSHPCGGVIVYGGLGRVGVGLVP